MDRLPSWSSHFAVRGRNTGRRAPLKGDHDCKAYLSAYGEALQRCELSAQLSIASPAMCPAPPAKGVPWNNN